MLRKLRALEKKFTGVPKFTHQFAKIVLVFFSLTVIKKSHFLTKRIKRSELWRNQIWFRLSNIGFV